MCCRAQNPDMLAPMGTLATVGSATGIGALDGLAASRDTDAGRSWTTPGIGATGPLVLGWGFAPAVQVGSAILGGAMLATGHESGRGPLCMGVGLMARAAALTLAQRRQTTPAKVQGLARPRAAGYAAPAAVNSPGAVELVSGRIGGSATTTIAG